ncbi:hypothetical protein [Achromobacter sp. ACM04]|uniref:hypothetical protein n=1 Tax=Achromobacter sp. ACM04 TaxID=2769312 RepID=UPI001CE1538D|nr:hypothetical protein [Achromobacter sp. ACM04]
MHHTLRIKLSFVLAAGAAIAAPVHAFDAERHPEYTLRAVELYRQCEGVSLSGELAEAFAEGTRNEDASILTLGQRIANWHFYNRDGKLRDSWFANRSLDAIFAKRNAELETLLAAKTRDSEQIYERAGRVLHYIQDMSVPAHVVPVYHAKLPLLGGGDPFDAYQPNALTKPSWSPAGCQELRLMVAVDPGFPKALLDATAQSTLQRIGQLGGIEGGDGWERYWIYPSSNRSEADKGWGSYPENGCEFVADETAPGCKSRERLDALFAFQYRDVLWNSVRMLIYLERRLAQEK